MDMAHGQTLLAGDDGMVHITVTCRFDDVSMIYHHQDQHKTLLCIYFLQAINKLNKSIAIYL